jgi:hypothetical protein
MDESKGKKRDNDFWEKELGAAHAIATEIISVMSGRINKDCENRGQRLVVLAILESAVQKHIELLRELSSRDGPEDAERFDKLLFVFREAARASMKVEGSSEDTLPSTSTKPSSSNSSFDDDGDDEDDE